MSGFFFSLLHKKIEFLFGMIIDRTRLVFVSNLLHYLDTSRRAKNQAIFSFTRDIQVLPKMILQGIARSRHNACHKKRQFCHNCDKRTA